MPHSPHIATTGFGSIEGSGFEGITGILSLSIYPLKKGQEFLPPFS